MSMRWVVAIEIALPGSGYGAIVPTTFELIRAPWKSSSPPATNMPLSAAPSADRNGRLPHGQVSSVSRGGQRRGSD